MDTLLKVGRYNFKPDWTIGRFYFQRKHIGFSVEDEIRTVKVHGETAIGYGTYDLGFRHSPKFSSSFLWSHKAKKLIEAKNKAKFPAITDFVEHELVWILNVPNFQFVLWHWGNSDDDTDACLVTGGGLGVDAKGQEIVTASRIFYMKWYPLIYPLVRDGGQKIEYIREGLI